jgi:hypothetical protein
MADHNNGYKLLFACAEQDLVGEILVADLVQWERSLGPPLPEVALARLEAIDSLEIRSI